MRRKHDSEEERTKDMSACHYRCAKRALLVFEKNGGIFIKLGQHLAALSYLIPIVREPLTMIDGRNGFPQCRCCKMLVHHLRWTP